MIQKRYQYFNREGKIVWTNWFTHFGKEQDPIQYKSGKTILRNEYRNVEENQENMES